MMLLYYMDFALELMICIGVVAGTLACWLWINSSDKVDEPITFDFEDKQGGKI